MFDKFLNDFGKNMYHLDDTMSISEQLALVVKGKIDYIRLAEKRVTVAEKDAKMLLKVYENLSDDKKPLFEKALSNPEGLRKVIKQRRAKIREAAERKERLLKENVSDMFELARNLKYLPGLEKVLTVNNTVDGMEATVQATNGTKYHFRMTPMDHPMMENFNDRRWYNDYKAWDNARRSVPTDDDNRRMSRYEGRTVARWSEDDGEGWILADKMMSEGWGSPQRRSMKTGSIKTPMIGRRVVMRSGEEGVVTSVEREPTFSQMVPYVLMYGIKLDSGERDYVKREQFKVRKDQPVEEDLSVVADDTSDEHREAVDAMRRAAINLVHSGVDAERARLELQTIGLNKGLTIPVAAELARTMFAQEMGDRRRSLDS